MRGCVQKYIYKILFTWKREIVISKNVSKGISVLSFIEDVKYIHK